MPKLYGKEIKYEDMTEKQQISYIIWLFGGNNGLKLEEENV